MVRCMHMRGHTSPKRTSLRRPPRATETAVTAAAAAPVAATARPATSDVEPWPLAATAASVGLLPG